jgi:prepilin-type N-terminal cleavage/methylation domain-containing protein
MFFRGPEKGFTLIELLVVIAIIGILTAVLVVGLQDMRFKNNLKLSALELVSNLRKVQNLAMSGSLTGTTVPPGGYGIRIRNCDVSPCSYILFADEKKAGTSDCVAGSDGRYQSAADCPTHDPNILNQDYELKKSILVQQIEAGGVAVTDDDLPDITFRPPRGSVYTGYDQAFTPAEPGLSVNIFLRQLGTDSCRVVRVIAATGKIFEEATACPSP